MATPSANLAASLEALRILQEQGVVAIRARQLSRTNRERLLKNGFISEVVKGWYIPSRPDELPGESTAWYSSFWAFSADYLNERFGDDWCLSPEHSMTLFAGDWKVPKQLVVRSPRAGNKPMNLPYSTSLMDVRLAMPAPSDIELNNGLRVYNLPAGLIASSPTHFSAQPIVMRAALAAITDSSVILGPLLEGGHTRIAGRLAGAFRNIGRAAIADNIVETMRTAGYFVTETDPFRDQPTVVLSPRERSPYVNRARMLWQKMREDVLAHFPTPPGTKTDVTGYLRRVDDVYVTDAYNSLSIEGYRVSAELIERVRSGDWNPDSSEADRTHRDALAARGYWQAFQRVKTSVARVLKGENAGLVADSDHAAWYRELFGPGIVAGLLRPADLAGYRTGPVFIRRSTHVPPNRDAVRDLMPAFFELLEKETEPAVRVVLGHFLFVYIHPYFDGNGRMGRFLMNVMLASGGYPWTVVPVEQRTAYMDVLEKASSQGDIIPFTQFLSKLVRANIE